MTLKISELEQFPALTWDEIAPQASALIRSVLERVLETQDGACLRDDERYALANCDGANRDGSDRSAGRCGYAPTRPGRQHRQLRGEPQY